MVPVAYVGGGASADPPNQRTVPRREREKTNENENENENQKRRRRRPTRPGRLRHARRRVADIRRAVPPDPRALRVRGAPRGRGRRVRRRGPGIDAAPGRRGPQRGRRERDAGEDARRQATRLVRRVRNGAVSKTSKRRGEERKERKEREERKERRRRRYPICATRRVVHLSARAGVRVRTPRARVRAVATRAFSLSSRKTRFATRRGRQVADAGSGAPRVSREGNARSFFFKLSELVSFPTSLVTLRAVETRVIITQHTTKRHVRRHVSFVRVVSLPAAVRGTRRATPGAKEEKRSTLLNASPRA